ncbi:double zinc ribbon domain-containing protein [Lactobacillaceae bacterium L1_55_11]|nr:double zinc ribbon domain-containing protein [Lactobacillaceae bacterium L1_55_11]
MADTCLLCGGRIDQAKNVLTVLGFNDGRQPLCATCLAALEPIGQEYCPGCGRQQGSRGLCGDCLRWQSLGHRLLNNRALYVYNDFLRDYIRQYKFLGDYRLRAVMQIVMIQHLKAQGPALVIPIPVSEETMQIRGFNQVTGWLPKRLYQPLLSVTSGHKGHQSHRTRTQRLATKQIFTVMAPQQVKGRQILLVDDIYTTGQTLMLAAAALYQAGAKAVHSVSLAR